MSPTYSRLRRCSQQSPSFRLHHCQSTIVTLVNILVKVFHSRDGAADLSIDVALVPHGQVGVVRDDPTVVKDKTRAARGSGQHQEVVSHLGIQRTPRDDDVKHLVLTTLVPFSQVDSDTDTYGQVHRTVTHLPNFQQLRLHGVGPCPVVVPSPVGWVAVGGVLSLGLESLGITFVASPIHHART